MSACALQLGITADRWNLSTSNANHISVIPFSESTIEQFSAFLFITFPLAFTIVPLNCFSYRILLLLCKYCKDKAHSVDLSLRIGHRILKWAATTQPYSLGMGKDRPEEILALQCVILLPFENKAVVWQSSSVQAGVSRKHSWSRLTLGCVEFSLDISLLNKKIQN